MVIGRPMTSAALYPNRRSAPRFQVLMIPSRSLLTMASSEEFDDRGEVLGRLLGAFALRQVEHESDTLIPAFLEGRRADQHGNTAAVFPEVLLLKRLQTPGHLQLGHPASFIAVTPFRRRQLRPAYATRDEILIGRSRPCGEMRRWPR